MKKHNIKNATDLLNINEKESVTAVTEETDEYRR